MKRIFTSIKFVVLAALCLFVGKVSAQTNLLTNGGFEEWTDGYPTGWKSTSTASSSFAVEQSADARTGNSSVLMLKSSSNKRLASSELVLKAGTYTFSVWVKMADEKDSVRLGYAAVNGASLDYKYATNYTKNLSSKEWKEVTHEFTLTGTTELSLLVYRSKNLTSTFLVDDASLTTTDGGIGEKEEEPTVELEGEGTKEKPYTVADLLKMPVQTEKAWFKGYIVGYIASTMPTGAVFGADGAVATNLLLAATVDETDGTKCASVQLPSGSVRTTLNLADNANMLGAEVLLYGIGKAYYGSMGVHSTSDYEIVSEGTPTEPEEPEDPNAEGTINNPYTVEKALEIINGGTASTEKVYVKGKISQIDEVSTSYGNANYYISTDGTTTTQLQVYRGKYFDNEKFTAEDQIAVGDEVVLYGVLVLYNGTTAEITNSEIISLNGATEPSEPEVPEDPDAEGGKNNPYTVEKALEIIDEGLATTDMVYVKGKISQIDDISTSYGNATYYISTDGTTTTQLMVFRGKYLEGEKFTATDQIAVGDDVVVYGVLKLYNTTPEITDSQLASLVHTDTPDEPQLPTDLIGAGTEENPYTVDDAQRIIASGVTLLDMVYVKGIISTITSVSTQYGNAEYYISDNGGTDGQLMVYRGKYLNNEKFTAEDQIAVGNDVVLYGKLKLYGETPEITDSYIFSSKTVNIEDVKAAVSAGAIEIYTLGGQKVADSLKGLKKGTYILKQGGKARVIVL